MIKTHFPLETALFIAPKPMHIIWFLYFYNIYEQDYDNVCSMLETITHHVVTLKAVRLGDVARYVRL